MIRSNHRVRLETTRETAQTSHWYLTVAAAIWALQRVWEQILKKFNYWLKIDSASVARKCISILMEELLETTAVLTMSSSQVPKTSNYLNLVSLLELRPLLWTQREDLPKWTPHPTEEVQSDWERNKAPLSLASTDQSRLNGNSIKERSLKN